MRRVSGCSHGCPDATKQAASVDAVRGHNSSHAAPPVSSGLGLASH